MVTQNNPLPFELFILEGKSQLKIPIVTLSSQKRTEHEHVYEVEELVSISLFLESSETDLTVEWGVLKKREEEGIHRAKLVIGEEEVLYRATGKERNPWRCGSYSFTLSDGIRQWYGTFRVRPKTMTLNQYEQMNQWIEDRVPGLVTDAHFRKIGYRQAVGHGELTNWAFLQWFEQNEHALFQTIHQLERVSKHRLTRYYVVEQHPKKQDARSARYLQLSKGQYAQQTRYANRKFKIDSDDEANRYVKYQLRQLLMQLQAVHDMLTIHVQHRKAQSEQKEEKVSQLKERHLKLNRNERVSMQELIRSDKTYRTNRIEYDEWEEENKRYVCQLKNMTRSLQRMQQLLYAPFWRMVEDTFPSHVRSHREAPYQQFHQLLMRKPSTMQSRRKGDQLVVKPTALLYEYYMYFHTIQLLERLDFKLEEPLESQLALFITAEGLQEGAYVVLTQGEKKVRVTYDAMIADDEKEALHDGSHFFSGGTHRKPDIRIDEERMQEGKWRYYSSFIIEVKYRPLHNLYIDTGKTDPMRQMCEYWMIKHIRQENEQSIFTHHAVRQVVCVYPGETNEPHMLQTGDGTFLKYHPHPERSDREPIGMNDLIALLQQWLND